MSQPQNHDDYLATLGVPERQALSKLRQAIHVAAPGAEECISYGVPAFRQGKMLVSYGATANHCAFYVMSGTLLEAFAAELSGRDLSKGTIRFPASQPLSASLVKKLVKARLAEMGSANKATKTAKAKPTTRATQSTLAADGVIARLKKLGTAKVIQEMTRYGIPNDKAFGIPVGKLKKMATELGKNHALALDLWKSPWYEARMLTAFVDEPALVTAKQMDSWRKDFDNWAICDTVCFHLFDRTQFAWDKVDSWSSLRDEFGKRAAFALLWSLSVHDRAASDEQFMHGLELIAQAADDERHYVKKGVNMALRAIGKRNATLRSAALSVAEQLAQTDSPSAQWIGKDALRELRKR